MAVFSSATKVFVLGHKQRRLPYHNLPQSVAHSQVQICFVDDVDEAALRLSSGCGNHYVVRPQNCDLWEQRECSNSVCKMVSGLVILLYLAKSDWLLNTVMPPTPAERPGIPGGPGGPGGPGTVTASNQNNQFLVILFRNIQTFRFNTLTYKYYVLF